MNPSQRLAQRLALALSAHDREDLISIQARLARVLSRLWEGYAELLDVRRTLVAAAGPQRPPVPIERFRPGDTLQVGDSFARSDPRLVLVEHLKQDAWSDLLGELSDAVLEAPELARLELLGLFKDLDESSISQLSRALEPEEPDTDEFPAPTTNRRKPS